MSNNYRHYIEYELRSKLTEAAELKAIADRCEETWRDAVTVRANCERAFERSIVIESDAKEVFRDAHSRFSSVRQEIGEIQDELFRTGEEQEGWHQ